MALAGAACILLFSYILSKMDYIPLVCIMCIKMLGNTLRPPMHLTPASAAPLPAELEIHPAPLRGKGDVALFGATMVTVISDTFCIFKTLRQKNPNNKKK